MTRHDLSGFWGGTYSYPSGVDEAPVPFDAELSQDGYRLTGLITEPNTFSPVAGAVLAAFVHGRVEGESVTFTKTYDGDGAAHAVAYAGSLREDGGVIEGVWRLLDLTGRFLMRRDAGTLATHVMEEVRRQP
ncbi:hypothetical protein [Parvularcula dongshanensis]|uniref:Lipocalin-like domain-containing protein n=1 Tax=Parvularcula dongshanensis TaxID=1173995 RepID=A0A840I1I6_9PROT|nr:hypothetical protein [Parvularcula dongshanensis]MBB4658143.1 hypothetical protein [Parvularcula dongshanensis]